MDPERNVKRLRKLFGVSRTILKRAARRPSVSDQEREEQQRKRFQLLRELRQQRISSLGANQRYVLEICADMSGVDTEEVVTGIVDESKYVENLNGLFEEKGPLAIMLCNAYMIGYPPESGRYQEKLKYTVVQRTICSRADTVDMIGKWMVVYRQQNERSIDNRTVSDDIGLFLINSDDRSSCLNVVKLFMDQVLKPSIEAVTEFGLAEKEQLQKFFHILNMYNTFLKSSDTTVSTLVNFDVSHELFKGFLLVRWQIEASSKIVSRVRLVERYFQQWLRQIQSILVEGKQIQRDTPDAGPLQMLVNWRRMLARYTSITEFVTSRAFNNHKDCLTLSRSSKLLNRWAEIDNQVTLALNEAKDNVRYISSLQKFWDPLYRSSPDDIISSLPGLMVAIRNVSKTAHYLNTPVNVTGLMVKISNQITITSKNYITDNEHRSLWDISSSELIEKIEKCKEVIYNYKNIYVHTVEEMKNSNEKPWIVSSVYIFTCLEKFLQRLDKIKWIANTEITYSILDRIMISGMEKFNSMIKGARITISSQMYDPLNYRIDNFDMDFNKFVKEVEEAEVEMQQFVKLLSTECPSAESVMLVLKRFEALSLECLCLDRRYLEVAEMLEKEMFLLKDVYNEERGNPFIPRNLPPFAGRIVWIRSIFKKIDIPVQALKLRQCVLAHKKAQRTVRYYNYMNGIICHYEMAYHKAWFDYVEEFRCLLNAPIMTISKDEALYTVNLDRSILQLMSETEWMWKLHLEVPNMAATVTYCKDRILQPATTLKLTLQRFDRLRESLTPVFINIMRFRLQEVSILLKPSLSFITWISENLQDNVEKICHKIKDVEIFFNMILDIEEQRILKEMYSVSEFLYIYVPEEPVSSYKFLEESNKLRAEIGNVYETHCFH
ncbi:dynein axonemal heavy chain 5-like [Drosophila willistoni]|uniref:dynein axonemal heavy chain 5-like n=1 Tax=Drosophila willistoni TaxID=7260 RepID=UPI001F07A03F|nr:dynein axonemal heavy chain 5-like [Drosophila willistoni]